MAWIDYNLLNTLDSTDRHPYVSIQRLCPDILAEIFTFCLHDVPKEPWRVECMSSQKAPLLLCSVCSSWRSLAISTPRLWQTLHFDTSSDKEVTIDTESITSGIRTWLDRSRALPLSIRANFWTKDPDPAKATKCRLIFEVLSQEVSRWESFELHDDGIWITPPHLGILPMLHTFDISGSSIDGIPFGAAPGLKRLGLYSPCPNPTSVSAIPWDQLVELTIGSPQTIPTAVEVIQCCRRLESLVLRAEEGDKDGDEGGSLSFRSITQHRTLRKLHLDMLPYVNTVTDHLTLPALTDLSIWTHCSIPDEEAKFHCSQLVAFFTRSNCELQKFALYHPEFGPGEVLECLSHRSIQTVTHLLIQGDESLLPMVDRELLIRLTYSAVDDDVPLCPKLAHLELNNCYCSDRSFPDLLGRMIQSRCFGLAQNAQLKSLRLFNTYSVSREDYELLQIAQSNGGLELKYSYISYREANSLDLIPGGGTCEDVDEGDLDNADD